MAETPKIFPWFETIPVGDTSVPGGFVMAQGIRYLYYSTPLPEPVLLIGFNAKFQSRSLRDITVQLCDMTLPDVWTPFYQTPNYAVFGDATTGAADAYPVLPLPEPYLIKPAARIQLVLRAGNSAILSTPDVITLVGIRDFRGGNECSN